MAERTSALPPVFVHFLGASLIQRLIQNIPEWNEESSRKDKIHVPFAPFCIWFWFPLVHIKHIRWHWKLKVTLNEATYMLPVSICDCCDIQQPLCLEPPTCPISLANTKHGKSSAMFAMRVNLTTKRWSWPAAVAVRTSSPATRGSASRWRGDVTRGSPCRRLLQHGRIGLFYYDKRKADGQLEWYGIIWKGMKYLEKYSKQKSHLQIFKLMKRQSNIQQRFCNAFSICK